MRTQRVPHAYSALPLEIYIHSRVYFTRININIQTNVLTFLDILYYYHPILIVDTNFEVFLCPF